MYKLNVVSRDGEVINFYQNEEIFAIDCITGEFVNKNDLLEALGSKLGMKLKEVFITYSSNEKERVIQDIAYSNADIPSEEIMKKIYIKFLREDRDRIERSFLRKVIKQFDGIDMSVSLNDKFKPYRTRRECYFHMVREGKIKLVEDPKIEPDYLKSLIDDIDTEDMSDESIMIEKIKSGEIEPSFYDIDDYVSMKRHRR